MSIMAAIVYGIGGMCVGAPLDWMLDLARAVWCKRRGVMFGRDLTNFALNYRIRRRWFGLEFDYSLRRRLRDQITKI